MHKNLDNNCTINFKGSHFSSAIIMQEKNAGPVNKIITGVNVAAVDQETLRKILLPINIKKIAATP